MKHSLEVICASQSHCPTCRDKDGGRQWRESLAQAFILPDGAPDFPCPHGLDWGSRPDPIALDALPTEIPRAQWPLTVRVVARLAKPEETGVGQTLTRLIGMVGGERYKRLMKRVGIDCGCSARAAMLDAMYPYAAPGE